MRRRIQSFEQYLNTRKGPPIVCDGLLTYWDRVQRKWVRLTTAEWKKICEQQMAEHDRQILGQTSLKNRLDKLLPDIRIEES